MTLRDLTPRQLYNLQRRCKKLLGEWLKRRSKRGEPSDEHEAYIAGYNAGLKDGLALHEEKS